MTIKPFIGLINNIIVEQTTCRLRHVFFRAQGDTALPCPYCLTMQVKVLENRLWEVSKAVDLAKQSLGPFK